MSIAAEAWPFGWPIEYPESDGKPMAESDIHRREMSNAIETLARYYADDPQVYVAGNLLLYYKEGDPRVCVAPDTFVVKGVAKRERRTYKLWEEKVPPQLVIEVSSHSTRVEDRGTKREIYLMLGVLEYFQWDPLDEYLDPALQGLRLVKRGYPGKPVSQREYQPIQPESDGTLFSEVLGLKLRREGDKLRVVDPSTGEVILPPTEGIWIAEEKARSAEEKAHAAEENARSAKEKVHAAEEKARSAEEKAHAAEEKARLEAAARETAEAELARLRTLLKHHSAGS